MVMLFFLATLFMMPCPPMADGKTHYTAWKYGSVAAVSAGVATAALGLYLGDMNVVAAGPAIVVGYGLGRWISPDLDLVGANSDEGRMMKELKIVGALLFAWFSVYAYLMRFAGLGKKGHRNFFSHFPGVSTVIRLAWLLLFPLVSIPIYFSIQRGFGEYFVLPVTITCAVGVVAGLSIADTLHYVLDILPSTKRK